MTSFQINSPGVSTKILLVVFAKLTLGLRIEDLSFPSHVMLGQSVTLSCEYSLDHSDEIDSIKWYRDNQEFYRIIQNQNFNEPERVSTFDRTGIKLDMQQSRIVKTGLHQLVLQDVDLNTTGEFRCQITLSGPPFHTEQRDKKLTVIIRPEGAPEIIGLRQSYTSDESIEVICTSKRSFPAAKLDFLINDEPASDDLVIRYPIDYDENDLLGRKGTERLQTSRIRLTYHLSPRPSRFLEAAATVTSANLGRNDIVSGLQERLRTGDVTMRLKCTAKIGNGYWKSTEKSTRLRHRERLLESRSASASNGIPFGYSSKIVALLFIHILKA